MRIKFLATIIIVLLLAGQSLDAQTRIEVKLAAKTLTETVPLNRTAKFTVELQWSGELADLSFEPPQTPRLVNFEQVGSSSTNKVIVDDGTSTAIRTYEYEIRPVGLGMGYVEGIRFDYTDLATGEDHSLFTDRLSIEVVEAVADPGTEPLELAMIAGLLLTVALAAGTVWLDAHRRKKARKKYLADSGEETIEQKYLAQLEKSVDLKGADRQESFARISKIIRQYLSEKLGVSIQSSSSADIVAAFRQRNKDMDLAIKLEEILQTSDLYKFSGDPGDPSKLVRVFTLAQNFIKANEQSSIELGTAVQAEDS